MSITIHSRLETELRARAEAEGISVETYLERLVRADQDAMEELAKLVHEGLSSGGPINVGRDYWQEKHRHLDEQLKAR